MSIAPLPEQVGVRSGIHEYERVAFDTLDKQPVRLDMAFAAAFEITGELVVAVFGR